MHKRIIMDQLKLMEYDTSKKIDVLRLRKIHETMNFPINEYPFLTEEEPIFSIKTYITAHDKYIKNDISKYIEKKINSHFKDLSQNDNDLLYNFANVTIYLSHLYLIQNKIWYNSKDNIFRDIKMYIKDLRQCSFH